jgi:tetratricopeptide (TPR) repeat protein
MGQGDDAVVAKSQQLILRGEAAEAVDLLRTIREPARDRTVRLLLGDAYGTKGDFASALAAYREIDDSDPIEAAVAWRLGQIYQQRGEPRRALEVYGRAAMTESDAVDHAWLLAGVATANWQLGDADQALAYSRAAGARAAIAGDPRVRAAAHIAMALAVSLGGDPATVEEHYAQAAAYAAEAGDQLARIDANRSHHLLADAPIRRGGRRRSGRRRRCPKDRFGRLARRSSR